MFERMRKCLDDFEKSAKKIDNDFTKEDRNKIIYFYLDFAKAMLLECPDVDKVGRTIVVEHGLFDDDCK